MVQINYNSYTAAEREHGLKERLTHQFETRIVNDVII
tara:strand:+ start:4614 stop:4724 length:111 start_codon:yes stop_codon:yes gene_type:complete